MFNVYFKRLGRVVSKWAICTDVLTYVLSGVCKLVVVSDSNFALGTNSEYVVRAGFQVLDPNFFTCDIKLIACDNVTESHSYGSKFRRLSGS